MKKKKREKDPKGDQRPEPAGPPESPKVPDRTRSREKKKKGAFRARGRQDQAERG